MLNTETYSKEDLARDTQTLVRLGYPEASFKGAASRATPKTPAGVIWNVTRFLSGASRLGKKDQSKLPKKGGGPTGTWTMLLRKLGYDGVVDRGDGIIHDNEPFQAVFFDTTKVELVEVIEKPVGGGANTGVSSLFDADYSSKKLNGANFSGRRLEDANFYGALLVGASFKNSNLAWVYFNETLLDKADFSGSELLKVSFARAHLKEAIFVNARFVSTSFENAVLHKANFSGADLTTTHLFGANFTEANLSNANLARVKLIGVNLKGANLSGANLKGAVFSPETILPDGFDPDAAGMVRPRYLWDNDE